MGLKDKAGKMVLIVEDDKDINALIAYNLYKEGFSVESVYDGLQAQERVLKRHFDVVILDIMLPGLDGFSVCQAIRKRKGSHKTLVIMVSAKAEEHDKMYAYLLGADCYLTKPFSVGKLLEVVRDFNALRAREYTVEVN
ncbi:MAG: response regulator [Candidatus Omnitrophica bacterium]|nr:response regulator [Candidatus Omnitrophota bacterium]